jgi:hypothetical protein
MNYPTDLVEHYVGRFVNRSDVWYKQWANAAGRSGYAYQGPDMDTKDGRFVYEPVTPDLVQRHLAGEITAGWTALSPDATCRWACWDEDQDAGDLTRIASVLEQWNFHPHREGGRPGRAGHLWLFFDQPVPAEDLTKLNEDVLRHADIAKIEFFPKQSKSSGRGIGNCVRGPLGINRKPEAQAVRGWFDAAPPDVEQQLRWLSQQPFDRADLVSRIAALIRSRTPRRQVRQAIYAAPSDDLLSVLSHIPAEDYDVWYRVGMALKTEGYDLSVWDRWSQSGSNYHEGECEKHWQSFNRRDLTGGTIRHFARMHGYEG